MLLGLVYLVVSVALLLWGWFTLGFEVIQGHVPTWGLAVSALVVADLLTKVAERHYEKDIRSLASKKHAEQAVERIEALPVQQQWTYFDNPFRPSGTRALVDRDEVVKAVRRSDA